MNVLSLCDGLSCGNMALEKVGIKADAYFASEIKPIAIKTTEKNFPFVVQVGDVKNISYENGVLHTEKGDYKINFDLVIFGSPCQSFSRAMRTERRIGLEDKEKSGLFLECHRVLQEVQPKYFLMENVVMKKEDEEIITELMGVSPCKINSKQLTAQMRERLYWTNIPITELPTKDVKVNDILTDGYYPYEKARCLMKNDSHGYYNGCNWTPSKRFYRWYYKSFSTMIFPSEQDFKKCQQEYERIVGDKKPSASLFDNYSGDIFNNARYLWKEERARLQTIPEKYIKDLSEKDASDLIGDGWTVDVIAHIFKGLL
jgi:site-specific DNA-cytosine methylase